MLCLGPMSPERDPLKAVGEFIRTQRRLADMSLRQLASMAKVSNPYLSQVERGIYKPSADVLKRVASALHLQAETLYSKAGLLEENEVGERPSVEEAIKLDPRLDTDQKETLIRVYRSLAGGS